MSNLINKLHDNTVLFLDAFGELNDKQLLWKPNEHSWSIAENIEHLIIINESYFPIFDSVYENNYTMPFLSKFSFIPSFFGTLILKSVQIDRKQKVKTFPIWEPKGSYTNILSVFIEHRTKFEQKIERIQDRKLEKIIISSPANKHIIYPLSMALDIIFMHEKRHLNQAKEVLKQIPT